MVTGYRDGSNGISLLTNSQTHKHTMHTAWVAVPVALIFLQLDAHPMASTDASKLSSRPPLRTQLHDSLKGHVLLKPPYKLHLKLYFSMLLSLFIAVYGS